MGCHAPFQGTFLTQESNPHLLRLLHWLARFFFLPLEPPGSPLGCTVRPPTPAKYVQILPFSTCDYGLITKKVIHRGNEVLVRACWIQGGS